MRLLPVSSVRYGGYCHDVLLDGAGAGNQGKFSAWTTLRGANRSGMSHDS